MLEFVAVEPAAFGCVLPVVVLGGFAGLVGFGVVAGLAVLGAVDPALVVVFGVVALVFGDPVCVVPLAGTQFIAPPFAGIPVCGFVLGVTAPF